ncbi:MAG: YbaB/EbfC family nucleoid-associated protein [PVC group bacterium]|nr:YbaB/EbfC family nucleoid-associated protein [PVC group bacterium]
MIKRPKKEGKNMLDKLKNMFEAQKKMNDIKKGLEKVTVEHEVMGGKIKVSMSGTQQILSVDIDDEYLSAEKKGVLQRSLVECLNGASEKVQKVAAQQLKASMGDLNIPGL